jgi:dTDP-4-dehydrorhamnose 3,5-epimerase
LFLKVSAADNIHIHMTSLNIISTRLPGVKIIERRIIADDRGSFFRLYCDEELADAGLVNPVRQINFSHATDNHTTKGIHFQIPPFAEDKIITCTRGEFFDVAVDLRKDSPTFLQWFSIILSEENRRSILIPRGFGHGCQSLKDGSSLLYLHTNTYSPAAERGFNILDKTLGIEWPHSPSHLSLRDSGLPEIPAGYAGIEII